MKKRHLILAVLFAAAGYVHADETELAAQGKETFKMQCARCHGPEGKGDGVDANRLPVLPRDITSGKFKFKSTVYGTPPSDDDIINGILGHGMAGAGMPSFSNLSMDTKKGLVAYIKTISPAFQGNIAPQPIPNPANMRASADLSKGKEVFDKLQCALCHGPNGRANGTSAFTLVDSWGRPIKPADLTHGWTYRGGSKPIDIYHRIVAGIDGAPMPSYEGAATHEEIWQLCNYVRSLQLQEHWSYDIVAAKVNGALPMSASDAQWKKAVRTDVNVQDLNYVGNKRKVMTVNAVSVQALYNDDAVVFRIFWNDPVKNEKNPSDALMVAFKPSDYAGDPRGNLHTLYEPNDPALDLSLWQASEPTTVRQKKSNVNAAAKAGWNPTGSMDAVANYDDGQWTLVFARPLALDKNDPIKDGSERLIGFAAWDGNNGESGLVRASSQWMRLSLGASAHE